MFVAPFIIKHVLEGGLENHIPERIRYRIRQAAKRQVHSGRRLEPELKNIEDGLLITCLNLAKHRYNGLIWFCDVRETFNKSRHLLNWDRLIRRARDKKIDEVVYYALYYTKQFQGSEIPESALRDLRPSPLKRYLHRLVWNADAILWKKKGRTRRMAGRRLIKSILTLSELPVVFFLGMIQKIPVYRKTASSFLGGITIERAPKELEENTFCLLAKRKGRRVGFAEIVREPAEERWRLKNISVNKYYRGSGIGKRLFEKAIKCGGDEGIKTLYLIVDKKNLPALRLYYKFGFAEDLSFSVDELAQREGLPYDGIERIAMKKALQADDLPPLTPPLSYQANTA